MALLDASAVGGGGILLVLGDVAGFVLRAGLVSAALLVPFRFWSLKTGRRS